MERAAKCWVQPDTFKKHFWELALQEATNANVHFELSIDGDIYGMFEHKISRDAVHIYKYRLWRWRSVAFILHLKVLYKL